MNKAEIYVNFFTNVAVAWFSAGVIATFFVSQLQFPELVYFSLVGIIGAYFSLQIAIRLIEKQNGKS